MNITKKILVQPFPNQAYQPGKNETGVARFSYGRVVAPGGAVRDGNGTTGGRSLRAKYNRN